MTSVTIWDGPSGLVPSYTSVNSSEPAENEERETQFKSPLKGDTFIDEKRNFDDVTAFGFSITSSTSVNNHKKLKKVSCFNALHGLGIG